LPQFISRDIDRGSVSSVASHQPVHHEREDAATVPKGTNMYKSDMPFTVTSSYPTPGMMKTIKDTVRNVLFPNCKFYRNADDANSMTGLVLHELGYSGNSETSKYMRVKSWVAVRELIMTTTAEARQAVIVRWYRASNGMCDLFVFHASSYVLLTQNKDYRLAWENKTGPFILPTGQQIIDLYRKNFDGITLTTSEKTMLYFFLLQMMTAVQRKWSWTHPGSYSKTVTPSDEAFGIFLLHYYKEIPDQAIIRKEGKRSERRKRLDGIPKLEAMEQYGDLKQVFISIRKGKSKHRTTRTPLLEIDGEIVAYVRSTRDIPNESDDDINRSDSLLSQQQLSVKRSVQDFVGGWDLEDVGDYYQA
jgi:hypothetical protein